MTLDEDKYGPALTTEEQRDIHEEVSKECLKFLLDNFIDVIDGDIRKTPIVSAALIQTAIEFCMYLAPSNTVGFALLHQILASVSVNQLKTDVVQKIEEHKELLTEEQKEKLEKLFGLDASELKTSKDILH